MTFDVTANNRYTQRLPRLCCVSQIMQMADASPRPAGRRTEGCRRMPKHPEAFSRLPIQQPQAYRSGIFVITTTYHGNFYFIAIML